MNANKQRPEYLDGAIGMHSDEKSIQLIRAVAAREGEVHVVEIGPGGGVALRGLADEQLDRSGLGLEGVTITTVEKFSSSSEGLARASNDLREQGAVVEHIEADATEPMPFPDESIDIVNTSAVFHEIYSYAGGKSAISKALAEIDRITVEGGELLYRDVYPVDQSMRVPVRQEYPRGSWEQFVRKFLPHYLAEADHEYDPKRVVLSGKSGVYGGTMPVGLAREVQRHYITFRDSIIRDGLLGVKIDSDKYDLTEWIRTEAGHEKKIYLAECEEQPVDDGLVVHEDANGLFVAASNFDSYVDQELVRFFEDLDMNRPTNRTAYEEWLGREGTESYVYGSVSEVTDMIRSGGRQTGDRERFTITDPDSYVISERDYYTRYLYAALGRCALPDKKLLITFEKVA